MRRATVLAVTACLVLGMAGVGSTVTGLTAAGTASGAATTSPPTASFDYSPSTPNPGDQITLDASASSDNGTIESYEWDGDGDGDYSDYNTDDPSDGETTTITFETGGTYTVGLEVTDDDGNTDTITRQITVENPAPDPSFSYSPSTPNPDDEITLDARGSSDPDGEIVSYEWDGDGDGDYSDYNTDDPSDGMTSSITFDSGGTYTVGLKVTDNGGKERTVTKRITVDNPAPEPTFSYSPSTPNPDDEITLDAGGSSDPDGEIVSYEWDGDNDGDYGDYNSDDPDDGEISTISFDSGGIYTVGLKITDNGGKERTVTRRITVDNPAPEPTFSYSPSTPNPDDEITLDAGGSSDPDGEIVSYEWDGDNDGDYGDYNSDDPDDGEISTISFDSGGTYTVGLKITDNGGKERTVTKRITVDNPAPEGDIDISPVPPHPDDEITLDASGSSDPDGSIVSYEWDTDGDGEFSEYGDDADDGRTTTVSYDTGGEYTVRVRVTDNGGKTATDQFPITVRNPEPTAALSVSLDDPNPDDEITLDASSSSDPDGEIVSYEWDTDGDGEYSEYGDDADDGSSATVSYDTEGEYPIALRVTDNGGKTATAETTITVNNTAPTPVLEVPPSTPNPDDEITLDASGSSDPDGEIVSYEWDTNGDGEYGEYGDADDGQTTTITYETGGTYQISLRVDDNGEKFGTITREITVENPPPVATFDRQPTRPELGETVRFNGSNSSDPDGEIVDYTWYIDGEPVDRGPTFETAFEREGSYNVTLAVTDNGDLINRSTAIIPVSEPPVAKIDYAPDAIGRDRTVTFDAGESFDPDGSITTYRWAFSDNRTMEGETVTRRFSEVGNHSVTLTVVDDATLAERTNETVTVHPIPSASISADPERPVEGTQIEFSAESSDDIATYEWDFDGDGTVDETGQTAPAVFDEYGEHTVSVAVTSAAGVTNRTNRTIAVDRNATFELTANRGTIEQGNTVIVTFSINNNIPDRTLNTKLQFALPDTGVSISSVEGGSVAGRSSTNFVTVPGGEQQTLRVRMQFNEPGSYNISGQSVYYYGNQSSSQQRSVGPVDISVGSSEPSGINGTGPGFGLTLAIVALLGGIAIRHRVGR